MFPGDTPSRGTECASQPPVYVPSAFASLHVAHNCAALAQLAACCSRSFCSRLAVRELAPSGSNADAAPFLGRLPAADRGKDGGVLFPNPPPPPRCLRPPRPEDAAKEERAEGQSASVQTSKSCTRKSWMRMHSRPVEYSLRTPSRARLLRCFVSHSQVARWADRGVELFITHTLHSNPLEKPNLEGRPSPHSCTNKGLVARTREQTVTARQAACSHRSASVNRRTRGSKRTATPCHPTERHAPLCFCVSRVTHAEPRVPTPECTVALRLRKRLAFSRSCHSDVCSRRLTSTSEASSYKAE